MMSMILPRLPVNVNGRTPKCNIERCQRQLFRFSTGVCCICFAHLTAGSHKMLPLQVNLSPVSTKDVLPMKRLVADGAVRPARTRHSRMPHRTPDKTVQNAADSWV